MPFARLAQLCRARVEGSVVIITHDAVGQLVPNTEPMGKLQLAFQHLHLCDHKTKICHIWCLRKPMYWQALPRSTSQINQALGSRTTQIWCIFKKHGPRKARQSTAPLHHSTTRATSGLRMGLREVVALPDSTRSLESQWRMCLRSVCPCVALESTSPLSWPRCMSGVNAWKWATISRKWWVSSNPSRCWWKKKDSSLRRIMPQNYQLKSLSSKKRPVWWSRTRPLVWLWIRNVQNL